MSAISEVSSEESTGETSREANESGHWTPAPLGMASFAFGLFLLSVYNAGLLSAAGTLVVIGPLIFYAGLGQLVAGLFSRDKDDVFGFTATPSYGMMLMSLGFILLGEALKWWNFGTSSGQALGIVFVAASIFTFYMWIASFKKEATLFLIFTTLMATLIALDLYFFGVVSTPTVGGALGIACSVLGWYTSAAIIINTEYDKTVLPVTWPRLRKDAERPLDKVSAAR